MIIKLLFESDHDRNLNEILRAYLGKEVFASWPHLSEVRIVKISNEHCVWKVDNKKSEDNDFRIFQCHVKSITDHCMGRLGIDVGHITVLVHALPLVGREYILGSEGRMTLKKVWSNIEIAYPLQAIVKDISVHNPDFVQYKQVEEVFQVGSDVFMLSNPFYGSKGEVVDPAIALHCGRIKSNKNLLIKLSFG